MENTNGRIVETASEARGGRLGRPVLVVLIVSTCLAVGFLAMSYIGYFTRYFASLTGADVVKLEPFYVANVFTLRLR